MEKFIHEIKMEEKDEFSRRFNLVSDYYKRAQELDTKEAWQDFFDAKLALEQGYPIADLPTD